MLRFGSKFNLLKGGEKMKTLGFVLVLMVLVASCYAATATITIYPGWRTISCPIVPFEPKPAGSGGVLQNMTWDDYSHQLMKYCNTCDPQGFAYYNYNYGDGVDPLFGNMLLGEGYMVYSELGSAVDCTYDGVDSGVPDGDGIMTDMWITLPKAGYHMVGVPYDEDIPIDQDTGVPFSFTDGTTVRDWPSASQYLDPDNPQWVDEVGQRWNGSNWVSAGINYYLEDHWKKGTGYLMVTYVDNLAMIITSPDNL